MLLYSRLNCERLRSRDAPSGAGRPRPACPGAEIAKRIRRNQSPDDQGELKRHEHRNNAVFPNGVRQPTHDPNPSGAGIGAQASIQNSRSCRSSIHAQQAVDSDPLHAGAVG